MTGAAWRAGTIKEVRALLPLWLACTAAVAGAGLMGTPALFVSAALAYGLGSVVLGAQSIGHEYSHRTLGLLLSLPSERRRLFLIKTGVLAVMLLALAAVAWATASDITAQRLSNIHDPSILFLVVLYGLFVAPCLTMIGRSPLAGVVFTITIPGVLPIAGKLIGLDIFKPGMFAGCAVAACASWILFMRLEAIDGPGADIQLPRLWNAAAERPATRGRPSRPAWLLFKKELRLHQMTFVITALYVLGWGVLAWLRRVTPEMGELPTLPFSMLYVGLMSMLIGSTASAEERQLGTLEWQVLLPMSSLRQWGIKVGTALGLAVALGVGIPILLAAISPSPDDLHISGRAGREFIATVLLLTSGSLYLSSVSSTGVRALVFSLAVIVALPLSATRVTVFLSQVLRRLPPGPLESMIPAGRWFSQVLHWLPFVLLAGLILILLRLGLENHRSADRSAARVWRQAAALAGYMMVALLLLVGIRA